MGGDVIVDNVLLQNTAMRSLVQGGRQECFLLARLLLRSVFCDELRVGPEEARGCFCLLLLLLLLYCAVLYTSTINNTCTCWVSRNKFVVEWRVQ